jgi:DNA polymerase III subunit delta'
MATVRTSSAAADSATDPSRVLPGIEAHPHARAVLCSVLRLDGGHARPPSHAYLLHGPSGAGKRTIARAFAAALLADGAVDEAAARNAAERVTRGTHPDLTWVAPSGAAEMLVSDIDEPVVAAVTRRPFESNRRVFVIERAETMNEQAANRLLKTLEEPPEYAHLVLVSDRREEVPATIASRCVHVRFDALSERAIVERLQAGGRVAEGDEGDLAARACARLALGDARKAEWLTSTEGRALRAAAEGYVRAALEGETGVAKRGWMDLLEAAKTAGGVAGEASVQRLQSELELAPSRERRKLEREALEGRRRAERRARSGALQEGLRIAELWLRDVMCLMEGAGELVYALDMQAELGEDARSCAGGGVGVARRGVELVRETRARIAVNVSEELALEALAYRLQALAGA